MNVNKLFSITICLVLLLPFVAIAQEIQSAADTVNSARYQVVEGILAGPRQTFASLSPDGTIFANIDRTSDPYRFCWYTLEISEQECLFLPEDIEGLDPTTVQWSPDSRFVTFTREARITLTDSDIWLFDLNRRLISNLTDDEFAGRASRQPSREFPTFFIDVLP